MRSCQVAAIHAALPQYERSWVRILPGWQSMMPREAAECALALAMAMRASTNYKEATGRTQKSTTANMVMTVLVVDTRHQETTGAVQHWAVAECGIAVVLPPSGNNASAPTMPPLAPPMAVLSSLPCPTTDVGAFLSIMGGGAHATPLVDAPLPCPSAVNGHLWMVRHLA
jgi:hypothetical protein